MRTEWTAGKRERVIDDAPRGASVIYQDGYLSPDECREMGRELEDRFAMFEQGFIIVGDRRVLSPRLVAAFGDDAYTFPDMGASAPWIPSLSAVRPRLEAAAGHRFNYALVNWYRDGNDFTGWHADKMHLHVPDTDVTILSLGATRTLRFRRSVDGSPVAEVKMREGSLVWMSGTTHDHYEHSVPVEPELLDYRLSVTFGSSGRRSSDEPCLWGPGARSPSPGCRRRGPRCRQRCRRAPLLIMFLCNHCPYVKHIASRLGELERGWAASGLISVAVNSNAGQHPGDAVDRMAPFAAAHAWGFPYLVDADQATARTFGAVCTPDLFLFDAEHVLVYHGQFDDSRPSSSEPVTGTDLDAAARRVLRRAPVPAYQRPSTGCAIKWAEETA